LPLLKFQHSYIKYAIKGCRQGAVFWLWISWGGKDASPLKQSSMIAKLSEPQTRADRSNDISNWKWHEGWHGRCERSISQINGAWLQNLILNETRISLLYFRANVHRNSISYVRSYLERDPVAF